MANYTSDELLRLGKEKNEMDFAAVKKPELLPCTWCHGHKGKTELQFSVIDDDFGQYVKSSMIKFCPFCGRSLEPRNTRTPKAAKNAGTSQAKSQSDSTACSQVIELLKSTPMTAAEVTAALADRGYKTKRTTVGPILTKMELKGIVKIIDKRKCSVTGRASFVYQAETEA